jgi:NTP pyrophosphatase (non-canonical NTP hydrolase)
MKKFDAEKMAILYEKILKFNDKRSWDPSAQDIAKSVVIEAAELLEHFQWDTSDRDIKKKDMTEIGFEMADVIWYLFNLANKLNIDIIDSMAKKLEHNEKKYPAEMFKNGDNEKFYYAQKQKYREEKKNGKK